MSKAFTNSANSKTTPSTVAGGQLPKFSSGEILQSGDLNAMVDSINNSVPRESHNSTGQITLDNDPTRGHTFKVNTPIPTPDATTGSSSGSSSTIVDKDGELALFDSNNDYRFRNRIGPYILEATAAGVLPEAYSNIAILQNSTLSASPLLGDEPSTYTTEIDALNRINGFANTLSLLTDATGGINKIREFYNVDNGWQSRFAVDDTNLKQNLVTAALAGANKSNGLDFIPSKPNYRLLESLSEYDILSPATYKGVSKGGSQFTAPTYYLDALSATNRRLNYLALDDIVDYFKSDTAAFGEYADATMQVSRSIYNPVELTFEGEELSGDYLNMPRQGTQLYGFANRIKYKFNDDKTQIISAEYEYPYFHCDGVNDMLGMESNKPPTDVGDSRRRIAMPGYSSELSAKYAESTEVIDEKGETEFQSRPDELALAADLGMLDLVVRVHDFANAEKLESLSAGLSSYGPTLSNTLANFRELGQFQSSPMVSYIPFNLVAGTLNANIPWVSDIIWDEKNHRLVKYYYNVGIKLGKIDKLHGSGRLSVSTYLDEERGTVYEQLTELPLSTIIFQAVPEQI